MMEGKKKLPPRQRGRRLSGRRQKIWRGHRNHCRGDGPWRRGRYQDYSGQDYSFEDDTEETDDKGNITEETGGIIAEITDDFLYEHTEESPAAVESEGIFHERTEEVV